MSITVREEVEVRKQYFVLLGVVIPLMVFALIHLLDGLAHPYILAITQGEATLLKESMKTLASETMKRPSHQWTIFLFPLIPLALFLLSMLVHYVAIYLRYAWSVLRALVLLYLVPVLAGFLSFFLVESTRTSCCDSSSSVRMDSRSAARRHKREERAQLKAARADFRKLFPPTQVVAKPPSHARRRRRAEALESLKGDEQQWLNALLADIASIDEATVREGAEEELRAQYLTRQQRQRYPQYRRRRR